MKQTIKCLVAVFAAMVMCVSAFAQVTTSSIAGKISDNEGVVVGAAVIATHVPSGTNYYSVTDKNGAYRINAVTPGGPYNVKVEMLGYRTVQYTGVYAPLGEVLSLNAALEVEALGLEAAVFTADGTDSGMNINRAGVGTSISERTMAALPTTSRSMNDVMKLTPQASTTTSGLAVGGGNYRSSYVTVDGAAFNNAFGIGENLPAGGAPISLDALEQMSVNITPFDVRHSGFTGGAINAVTKSGSNEWHASVYNYYNSNYLKGNKVAGKHVSVSETLNNTTGFTVGGPIIKNKLFFFVNFEYTADVAEGSKYKVRSDENQDWGDGTAFVRPTETFMNDVKQYLSTAYGYDPGRFQDYSLSTPDWKLMARVDWKINDDHRFNIRYSHTMNKTSSTPSSSISPLSGVYDRNVYGRTSMYSQYFESSRYFQEQNFMSLAAELNSRFGNNASNLFRVTWSHQNEPRSFVGDLFPTVDILETVKVDTNKDGVPDKDEKAVLTSFGPDPFTYGNLRDVQTVVVTDEFTYNKGINNIVAGLQFEWNDTKNGYMQGGAGYYVFNSWEDFKSQKSDNPAAPAAFAITHSNRDDLKQVYPSFQYMQASAYLQDELTVSDNFKLTAGLRFEMPIYPTIAGNYNKEFATIAAGDNSIKGLSTADMPKARLNVSPRVGFNWDVLKNRNLILRGGTGIYTGRVPFVWIVSAAGNSNCLQAQFIDSEGTTSPEFSTSISGILNNLYGGKFKAKDLPAPTATTIMDKNLKMPSTWKSSLALEGRLPGGIKATLEGIYNKDLTSVYVHKLGQKLVEGGVSLPGEPEARPYWKTESLKNNLDSDGKPMVNDEGKAIGKDVQPYYITNTDKKGYYWSVTAMLQKDFNFGLSMMAAYTRSASVGASEGIGDQVSSAYNTMTYTSKGSNIAELGHSSYVSPNRIIANISYRIQEGSFGATTLGLFYEGYNHCYVGNFSYSRLSYTMLQRDVAKDKTFSVTGDGGAYNLLYIPTDEQLEDMPFADENNKAEYKKFLETDKYLSAHRGEYSQRGGMVAPWQHRFSFKVAQDFDFMVAKKKNTIQVALDINNLGNLFNSNWGAYNKLKSDTILEWDGTNYTFVSPKWSKIATVDSTWSMLLSLRYFF